MNIKYPLTCFLFIIFNILEIQCYINGVTKYNIKSYVDNNKFLIVFINSPSCTRCRKVYKNFVSASLPFHGDREIFFGKTSDLGLMQKWKIEELPAIVYFPMGVEEPELFEGEYTVDNIIDTVAYAMKGNFGGLQRVYYIEVNEENYEELIIKPQQHVMLLIYDQYHEEQKVTMMDIAKIYKDDDDVVLAVLDADKNKSFRDKKFNFPGSPLLYWFPIDDKYSIKRFGGDLTYDVIFGFINDQTNSWRSKDGTLMLRAGRFEALDKIIIGSLGGILRMDEEVFNNVIEEAEKVIEMLASNELEYGKYYLFLLQQMKVSKGTEFLTVETDKIFREMEDLDIFSRKRDVLIRKQHIIDFLVVKIADYIMKHPSYKEELIQKFETKKTQIPEHHEL